jgi:hypothetical protein
MQGRRSGWLASVAGIVSAAPDLALALWFLTTWIDPLRFGPRAVSSCLGLMILEFVVVHSSMIMVLLAFGVTGSRARKAALLAGFSAVYSLFAAIPAVVVEAWWPFAAFWGLTLNRMLGVLFGGAPDGREKGAVLAGWMVSVALYVVLAGITASVPLPALGVTPAIIALQQWSGSGLWLEQPHRVVAFGFLYFTGQAVFELVGYARLLPVAARVRRPVG